MRRLAAALLAALGFLSACSDPSPPTGRWAGTYEADDVMIVARLEIAADGMARVTAPNAFMDFAAMSEDERDEMRTTLSGQLAQSWPYVAPRPFTFDGKVFRKPGGVAPQMEWDAARKRMTLVVYPGTHPTIRMPVSPIESFE